MKWPSMAHRNEIPEYFPRQPLSKRKTKPRPCGLRFPVNEIRRDFEDIDGGSGGKEEEEEEEEEEETAARASCDSLIKDNEAVGGEDAEVSERLLPHPPLWKASIVMMYGDTVRDERLG
ncbi:hypothetical protein P691DRAFT_784301 [Macrolepiota fuliginosa MF-IS2]|uniref:Uncharacterized protein n=1 Tax=Macrolepiota fuliginosa MF-IS2 TaxID=1400762 RepID=A0A9P6C2B0_9AGAR|nr:hypothetical protein P691DRAFT_784301 [Macrolepiota fuliginosa MF-IS2]